MAVDPAPLSGLPHPPRIAPPEQAAWQAGAKSGLLLTEDDLSPAFLFARGFEPDAVAVLNATRARSPLHVSESVLAFADGAVADTVGRYADRFGSNVPILQSPEEITGWAADTGLTQVVAPYVPVGPAADILARVQADTPGVSIVQVLRDYDLEAWPHAKAGFFKFKEKIPSLLGNLRGLKAAQ